jgi:hypothetical protein
MSAKQPGPRPAEGEAPASSKKPSKKDQILSLYSAGIQEIADLAHLTRSRASYVAGVLQEAGEMKNYFDLYTSSNQPMNAYSKFFAGRLGFKDEETARASVELIDRLYKQFALTEDRAGQHHALVMALTMFDRARWTGKGPEAEVFRQWLVQQLPKPAPAPARPPDREGPAKSGATVRGKSAK